jgi:antirestriction protein
MSYATTLDLRNLASKLRDELGYCSTSCTECDGSGSTEVECSTCGGTGDNGEWPCEDCKGSGVYTEHCDECDGDGEVFSLEYGDEDDIRALVELAEELANKSFDLTEDGINAAADELAHVGDHYEPTLILAADFEQYAEELANDLGEIPDDAGWPMRHIDWEAAADELRHDYTSVSYAGDDYLIRSF